MLMATFNPIDWVDSIKINRPGRVIVLETTGCALYGAIASCFISSSYRMGETVVSAAVDFDEAVGEVVGQLGKKTRLLPKQAVLVTPSAAADLLYLPVDPKKPRPRLQMAEMVRWELEELFVRLNDSFSLGALLQGRGYLSSGQRKRVEEAAAGTRQSGSSLFGELVSGAQVEECMAIQEQLSAMDEELVIGAVSQAAEHESEQFCWYGGGVGEGIRNQWAAACRKHGVRLQWIYPQLGSTAPLVESRDGGWILVEVRQEQCAVIRGEKEKIAAVSSILLPFGVPEPALIGDFVRRQFHPEVKSVFLSCSGEVADQIALKLKGTLPGIDSEITVLGSGEVAETVPAEVRNSMNGAAAHALRRCLSSDLVRIEAQAPKPPLLKNKEFWPWVVLVLLVGGIGFHGWYIRDQIRKKSWELDLLDIEYERKLKIKEEARQTVSEVRQLEGDLEDKKAELAEQRRLAGVLDNVIRYRQDLVPGILQAVAAAVNDRMMVDMIEEDQNRKGFYLEGWALGGTDSQLFGNRLNETLEPWNYKVENTEISRGTGRLKVEGYILKMRLVKFIPEKENTDD